MHFKLYCNNITHPDVCGQLQMITERYSLLAVEYEKLQFLCWRETGNIVCTLI